MYCCIHTRLSHLIHTALLQDGKYQARSGCHDDTIMSLGIAVTVHQEIPFCEKVKIEYEKDYDDIDVMEEIRKSRRR